MDPESIGYNLDWKEFEAFSETAFTSFGFKTFRNYRLRKPRGEIDLIASQNGLAFVVDCKHWKRTVGNATMISISERQIRRTKRLLEDGFSHRMIPMVLTWHDEHVHILENGVPVVPIHKISDFIMNWEQSSDQILVLAAED